MKHSCSSGCLSAPCCRLTILRRSGLAPLQGRQHCLNDRRPHAQLVKVHSAFGIDVFIAAQEQVKNLAAKDWKVVQAALAATAAFVQQALRQVWLAAVASWHLAVLAEQQQQQQQVHALVSGGDEPQTPLMKPLEAFAAATSGAVERLRHTLTDASSTLESKWTALEATVGGSMSSLFMATSKSAEALNSLGPEGADGSVSRQWHQQATEIVVQHEEALYQQVFVQVYGELLSKDNRQISYNSV